MNMFDLFVRIGVQDEASDKLASIGEKMKGGLAAAGTVAAAGVGVAATAVAALTKQAVAGYAETEQLRGGVETLFKESASTIEAYANEAYKTAGLSANEYMETVTGFSASMLASLGGDTAAAAEMADMAITDMADNANKMGTDISMIQNAYQGFAKQNYTMLDNLKLGYGGTKEEMQRLLDDASKLSGMEFDISSFADITEAIHIVQEEMDIAGATAAEAESTISGSAAAMKSAWTNLVAGLADENANVDQLLDNFLSSVDVAAGNVLPIIQKTLSSIGSVLSERGPDMVASGAVLLAKLGMGIVKAIPGIIAKIPEIVVAIVEAFKENGPEFQQIGSDIVRGLWEGVKNLGSWLKSKIKGFFDDAVGEVKDFLGIHSPSRVFAGIGENMALGVGQGWDNEYDRIRGDITSGLDFGTGTVGLKASASGRMGMMGGGDIVLNVTNEVGGVAVARHQYRYNMAEEQRRGNNLVMA